MDELEQKLNEAISDDAIGIWFQRELDKAYQAGLDAALGALPEKLNSPSQKWPGEAGTIQGYINGTSYNQALAEARTNIKLKKTNHGR